MPLPEEFHDLARKVNNWGRWGEDDERGTLNLITPEVVQRAAACVRHGRTFSLAIPLSVDGPQTGAIPGRSNPVRTMLTVNEPFTGDEHSSWVTFLYRGNADTVEKAQRRVEFDLEYIARWSLLFDLRILVLTAVAMISGKEAY